MKSLVFLAALVCVAFADKKKQKGRDSSDVSTSDSSDSTHAEGSMFGIDMQCDKGVPRETCLSCNFGEGWTMEVCEDVDMETVCNADGECWEIEIEHEGDCVVMHFQGWTFEKCPDVDDVVVHDPEGDEIDIDVENEQMVAYNADGEPIELPHGIGEFVGQISRRRTPIFLSLLGILMVAYGAAGIYTSIGVGIYYGVEGCKKEDCKANMGGQEGPYALKTYKGYYVRSTSRGSEVLTASHIRTDEKFYMIIDCHTPGPFNSVVPWVSFVDAWCKPLTIEPTTGHVKANRREINSWERWRIGWYQAKQVYFSVENKHLRARSRNGDPLTTYNSQTTSARFQVIQHSTGNVMDVYQMGQDCVNNRIHASGALLGPQGGEFGFEPSPVLTPGNQDLVTLAAAVLIVVNLIVAVGMWCRRRRHGKYAKVDYDEE